MKKLFWKPHKNVVYKSKESIGPPGTGYRITNVRFIDTDRIYNRASYCIQDDQCEIRMYDEDSLRYIKNKPYYTKIKTFVLPVESLHFFKEFKNVNNIGRGCRDKVWTYTVRKKNKD